MKTYTQITNRVNHNAKQIKDLKKELNDKLPEHSKAIRRSLLELLKIENSALRWVLKNEN